MFRFNEFSGTWMNTEKIRKQGQKGGERWIPTKEFAVVDALHCIIQVKCCTVDMEDLPTFDWSSC